MAKLLKHALILAHPNAQSFNASVARTYRDAVEALGHRVILRDLYRSGFDPRLQDGEIPRPTAFAPAPEIAAERALIADADVFAFVYPLWFNAPPAMISGYVQRVFGMGFGYGPIRAGRNQQLLLGRRMISFSSSGAPAEWLRSEGSWNALRNLFDDHVAEVCGLTVLDHRHYGRLISSAPASLFEAHLRDVKRTVERNFAAA
ncbi:MAG: NAD(P)H-dependent oxidoreductase [Hyphomonadaceae bacterium]